MFYDDDFDFTEEYTEECSEETNLADEFSDLRDTWNDLTSEIRENFAEMFSSYDELFDNYGEEIRDDPELMKDAVAISNMKMLAAILANCGTTVGNFLNATADLMNGEIPAFQIHNESPKKIKESYSPGDHLRLSRGVYTHHGIYTGDGKVVHYSQGYDKIPEIREVPFAEFAGVSKVDVVSESESPIRFSRKQVVERAYSRLGEQNYNLIYNNCENFVRWCRAGC